jgi:photosynthetic reaction center cytochrome c subunit
MHNKLKTTILIIIPAFLLGILMTQIQYHLPLALAANTAIQIGQGDKPFDQEQALADLRKAIAGQEMKSAGEVFKNVQILKGLPAGRLLKVMELGYARSLGVNCTHCHVPGEWEKENKPTKQIARDMMGMANTINNDLLKKIKNLKSATPTVNCTTCHRGQIKPELNLPEKPKA